MVEKISINVKVPSLNIEHNFLIPKDMEISLATSLIIKTITEEYPGVASHKDAPPKLIKFSSGELLAPGATLSQLDFAHGEKLILL